MESWYNSVLQSWPMRRLGLYTEEPTIETCEKKPGEQFTAVLAPWESYIVTLQSLLIWEKPIKSFLALLAFNFLYWFCVCCEPKPLFVLSSAGLIVFLHQQWVHTIWPEIRVPLKPGERPAHYTDEWLYLNPSVLSAPEVGLLLDQWCSSGQAWLDTCVETRRHRPALFCLCSCCFFTLLLFTGQLMPGSALLYLLISVLFLLPGAKLHVLPVLKLRAAALLQVFRRKCWDRLAIGTSSSGSRESSPDELSEFLPELGSAEAEAALAVPLTSEDPPEVVAAVARSQAAGHPARGAKEPDAESHLYPSPRTAMLSQDSPYGSLAPHIPNHSQIPGVSDSSDEEEQEFMQGLVFDASSRRERGAPLHASYPPPSLLGSLDYTDSTPPGPSPYDAPAEQSSSVAMQNLASSILQYSQAGSEGAGALLSSLGQSMFTSVMNNMNQAATRDAAHHHPDAAAAPHYRDDLSDDFSEPDVARRAPERRVRRRPKRSARTAGGGHQQELVTESEDVPSNGDFEFISDEDMSE